MYLEEMSYAIESMFPNIRGGSDYLLQASVNPSTDLQNPDAEIIMWNLPIDQPTNEQIKDFFLQVKDEYAKTHNDDLIASEEEARKQKVVDGFLGKYGN
jgi:hypothetical protein